MSLLKKKEKNTSKWARKSKENSKKDYRKTKKKFKDLLNENLQNDSEFKAEYKKSRALFEIKKALISARIEAGLSQAKIASIMKVSQSSVARFESCEFGDFKFSTFEKYLHACGKDFTIALK